MPDLKIDQGGQAIAVTVMAPSFPASKPPVAAARDTALDFTKGLLVLFMVLYHWLNYFIGKFGPEGKYYDYLRFLTPGFIFITGFLISHVSLQRYGGANSRLASRLAVRGLKLLAIFVGLNILAGFALPGSLFRRSLEGGPVLKSLVSIFGSGDVAADAGTKTAAFSILVPFAYLLILSAGLILVSRRIKYAFHFACAVTLILATTARIQGIHSLNLELVMAGLLGVVFGYAKEEQLAAVRTHPYLIGWLYCAYLAAITFQNMSLPLQITSVILTTTLFYILGARPGPPGIIRQQAILLGKYSLLGYISQIAILQVLRRIAWLSQNGVIVLISSLILAALLTVLTVVLVDWARGKSKVVSQIYQVVFA
jgi:fucose 4-O-acetylase-like acetyltransferase